MASDQNTQAQNSNRTHTLFENGPSRIYETAVDGNAPAHFKLDELKNRLIDTSKILSEYADLVCSDHAHRPAKTNRGEPNGTTTSSTTAESTDSSTLPAQSDGQSSGAPLERRKSADDLRARYKQHCGVVERLRAQEGPRVDRMKRRMGFGKRPTALLPKHAPSEDNVCETIKFFMPERNQLEAFVVDIKDDEGKFDDYAGTFDKWEELCTKPDDVKLRWIHVPLGRGLTHSSLEDLFRHARLPGISFDTEGRPEWPYLEMEMLQFRDRTEIENMRFLLSMFQAQRKEREFDEDSADTNGESNKRENKKPNKSGIRLPAELMGPFRKEDIKKKFGDILGYDLLWRKEVVGQELDYLNLVKSDIPWLLNDRGLDYKDASGGNLEDITRHEISSQAVSKHNKFAAADAVLVVEPLRIFHSTEGFLLTMSAQSGIDFVRKDFKNKLKDPRDYRIRDRSTSAICHLMSKFEEKGMSTWPAGSNEERLAWLIVYILTEVAVTPHDIWDGMETSSMIQAYHSIVRELGREKERPWRDQASQQFLSRYIDVADETGAIIKMTEDKIKLLTRLKDQVADVKGRAEAWNKKELKRQEELIEKLKKKQEDRTGNRLTPDEQFRREGIVEKLRKTKQKSEKKASTTGVAIETGEHHPTMNERIDWAVGLLTEQRATFIHLQKQAQQSHEAFTNVRTCEQTDLSIKAGWSDEISSVIALTTALFLPPGLIASMYGMNLALNNSAAGGNAPSGGMNLASDSAATSGDATAQASIGKPAVQESWWTFYKVASIVSAVYLCIIGLLLTWRWSVKRKRENRSVN